MLKVIVIVVVIIGLVVYGLVFFFGDIIFVFNFIYIEILNKKVVVEFVWYILFVVNMILFCNFELIFLINVNIWIKNDFSINVDMI